MTHGIAVLCTVDGAERGWPPRTNPVEIVCRCGVRFMSGVTAAEDKYRAHIAAVTG